MIWTWLVAGFQFILKLFIPEPKQPADRVIDPNAKCPACGNRSGRIIALQLPTKAVVVRHICAVCAAIWHQNPVMNEGRRDLIMAMPMTPIEASMLQQPHPPVPKSEDKPKSKAPTIDAKTA